MKEICKGCNQVVIYVSRNKVYKRCIFTDHEREDKCPCYECLVRVMCSVTCDDKLNALGSAALGHLHMKGEVPAIDLPTVEEGKDKGVKWVFRD